MRELGSWFQGDWEKALRTEDPQRIKRQMGKATNPLQGKTTILKILREESAIKEHPQLLLRLFRLFPQNEKMKIGAIANLAAKTFQKELSKLSPHEKQLWFSLAVQAGDAEAVSSLISTGWMPTAEDIRREFKGALSPESIEQICERLEELSSTEGGKEVLIEWGRSVAAGGAEEALKFLRLFGIEDQATKEAMALIAVQVDPQFPKFLAGFGLQDKALLLEFAEHAVKKEGSALSFLENSHHFQLSRENDKRLGIEAMKMEIATPSFPLSSFAKELELSEREMVDFAKARAEHAPDEVAQLMSRFRIQDEEARFEIAQLVFQGTSKLQLLQNFQLKDPAKLGRLLGGVKGISESVEGLNQEPKVRFEIAKAAAQRDPKILEHVHNYDLDLEQLKEVLRAVAAHQPRVLFNHLSLFEGEEDQAFVKELLGIALEANGDICYFLKNLKKLPLAEENDRFEFALALLDAGRDEIPGAIQAFDLTEEHRLAIAQHLSEVPGLGHVVLNNLINFKISDEKELIKIIDNSVKNSGTDDLIGFISNLNLIKNLNETEKLNIAKFLLNKNALFFLGGMRLLNLSEEARVKLAHEMMKIHSPEELIYYISEFRLKEESIQLLLLTALEKMEISKEVSEAVIPLFLHVVHLRDPTLRSGYLVKLTKVLSESHTEIQECLKNPKKGGPFGFFAKILKPGVKEPTRLLALGMFFGVVAEEAGKTKREESLEESLEQDYAEFFKAVEKQGKKFKDSIAFMPALRGIEAVVHGRDLSSKEKFQLVNSLVGEWGTGGAARLKALQGLILAKEYGVIREELAKKLKEPSYSLNFEEAMIHTLFKLIDVDKGEAGKYREIFGKDRDPIALFIYAANLNDSEGEKTLATLKEFVKLVLSGKFEESRYDLSKSPHLKRIFEKRPQLLAQWRAGLPARSVSQVEGPLSTQKALFSWMKTNLAEHSKLSLEELSYMKKLLAEESPSEETGKSLLQALNQEINAIKKPAKPSFALKMQRSLLELFVAKSPKERLQKAKELMALAGAKEQLGEFYGDLQTLSQQIKGPLTSENLTVAMTDNRVDMLLSGTEIIGSCQAVDYGSSHNKCLMGHLMNGKTQLICVKDEQGKLVARRLVRLFWDPVTKRPVMMLERLYTNRESDPTLDQAIRRVATEKAKEMGVACVVSRNRDGALKTQPYPGVLESQLERAPFEYLDGIPEIADGREVHQIENLGELVA